MEFRWLTTEEQRTRTVGTDSLSEVLALAQKLQAEGEGWLGEEQVVEMGRELGVQPQYVREALRLRRRAAQPPPVQRSEPAAPPAEHNSVSAAAQTLATLCGLLLLPLAMNRFYGPGNDPIWLLFMFAAAFITGWSVRSRRLAGLAGALASPAVLLIALIYSFNDGPGLSKHAVLVTLLAMTPLCSTAGRVAAAVRRGVERLADRERWDASLTEGSR